jgi:hypothetical protein
MGQMEFPSEPNWQPLQLLLPDEKLRIEFMFMGTFVAAEEEGAVRIELYKHQSSRRYLNIDSEENCYVYDDAKAARGENTYRKISRQEALGNLRAFGQGYSRIGSD